jgi:hypothetical protein
MILKGTIHGRTIVLDRDPGFEDGREVAIRLADPALPTSEQSLEASPLESWKRWQIELEKSKSVKPGDGLWRAAGGWGEFADEVDEFLKASRRKRDISRDPLEL